LLPAKILVFPGDCPKILTAMNRAAKNVNLFLFMTIFLKVLNTPYFIWSCFDCVVVLKISYTFN
jgi:hypothetical protein